MKKAIIMGLLAIVSQVASSDTELQDSPHPYDKLGGFKVLLPNGKIKSAESKSESTSLQNRHENANGLLKPGNKEIVLAVSRAERRAADPMRFAPASAGMQPQDNMLAEQEKVNVNRPAGRRMFLPGERSPLSSHVKNTPHITKEKNAESLRKTKASQPEGFLMFLPKKELQIDGLSDKEKPMKSEREKINQGGFRMALPGKDVIGKYPLIRHSKQEREKRRAPKLDGFKMFLPGDKRIDSSHLPRDTLASDRGTRMLREASPERMERSTAQEDGAGIMELGF